GMGGGRRGGGGRAERGGGKMARAGKSLGRGNQFRSGKIDLKKIVGDDVTAAFVAVEKVMAATVPEISHLRSRSASVGRSICSPGSSSPSTSRKEKTRAGLTPSRGRSVRKLSRTVPSS